MTTISFCSLLQYLTSGILFLVWRTRTPCLLQSASPFYHHLRRALQKRARFLHIPHITMEYLESYTQTNSLMLKNGLRIVNWWRQSSRIPCCLNWRRPALLVDLDVYEDALLCQTTDSIPICVKTLYCVTSLSFDEVISFLSGLWPTNAQVS